MQQTRQKKINRCGFTSPGIIKIKCTSHIPTHKTKSGLLECCDSMSNTPLTVTSTLELMFPQGNVSTPKLMFLGIAVMIYIPQ